MSTSVVGRRSWLEGMYAARAGWLLALLIGVSVLQGCDQSPEAQVRRAYDEGEVAIANYNTDKLSAMMSQSEHEYWVNTLAWAKRGRRPELERLPLGQLLTVLSLRNRLTSQQLRELKQEDMLVWMIQSKVLSVDAEFGIKPISVSVSGDAAQMQMGMYVETERRVRVRRLGRHDVTVMELVPVEGFVNHYVKVGGTWVWDHEKNLSMADGWWRSMAKDEGVSPIQYLLDQEESEHGSLKRDIWQPVE